MTHVNYGRARLAVLGVAAAVLAILGGARAANPKTTFTAAAVQHVPIAGASPMQTMHNNLEAYALAALDASRGGADIVVFPEFGLLGNLDLEKCGSSTDVAPYCQPVPAPAADGQPPVNPCANPESYSPAVVAASCMSLNASVTTSVNTCEQDGSDHFNTNIVMNEKGQVVAKYRKSHVWYKDCFTEPATPDLVTFQASFGVEFGLFTCFDIVFPTPGPALAKEGIRHFLTSAAIPLVGASADKLWSWRYGSALIAADAQLGESGVFVKGSRLSPDAPSSGTAVLMAAVPIDI